VENRGWGQRKKKGAKKKENGGLWKLTPLMEIRSQRGFPQRLGKHKTLSTVPTRPGGDGSIKGFNLSRGSGPPYTRYLLVRSMGSTSIVKGLVIVASEKYRTLL
jgi:hypothetical protein